MNETVFLIIDGIISIGLLIFSYFCLRYVIVSLRRRFVYINGKVASLKNEMSGFVIVIVSYCILSALFIYASLLILIDLSGMSFH